MISFSGNFQTTSETKGTKQEQEESTDEDPSLSLFSHKIYDWIQKSISLGNFEKKKLLGSLLGSKTLGLMY